MEPLTVRYRRAQYAAFVLWAFVWCVAIALIVHHPFTGANRVVWSIAIALAMAAGPLLARHYTTRVTIAGDQLTIHRFAARTRTYRLSDLTNFKVIQDGDGTRTAVLSFTDGYRLTVDGYAAHFGDFCRRLEQRGLTTEPLLAPPASPYP